MEVLETESVVVKNKKDQKSATYLYLSQRKTIPKNEDWIACSVFTFHLLTFLYLNVIFV